MSTASDSSATPRVVTALRILFVVNAALWIALGAFTLSRMASGSSEQASVAGILAAMMAAYALVLCFVAWSLGRRKKIFYYFAVLVVLGTIVLTFTDQFGLADIIGLALNVGLLALLFAARRWYLLAG
jgi:uncharacterized membrane protein YgdD (TMEM256/DUF423 family)